MTCPTQDKQALSDIQLFRFHALEEETNLDFTTKGHLEGLKKALLELLGGKIAKLLIEDWLLQNITPVVEAITKVRANKRALLETTKAKGKMNSEETMPLQTQTTSRPKEENVQVHDNTLQVQKLTGDSLTTPEHTGLIHEGDTRPKLVVYNTPNTPRERLPPLMFAMYKISMLTYAILKPLLRHVMPATSI